MKKSLQRKYAKLLVKQGVNIQKGQQLSIYADVEVAPFVEILAQEGYRAGAGKVVVEWTSTALTKLSYRHRSVKSLCDIPAWTVEKAKHESEILPAKIHIISQCTSQIAGTDNYKIVGIIQA